MSGVEGRWLYAIGPLFSYLRHSASANLMQADWANVLSVSLMGGVLSLLTSIAGIPEVDDGSSLATITDGAD